MVLLTSGCGQKAPQSKTTPAKLAGPAQKPFYFGDEGEAPRFDRESYDKTVAVCRAVRSSPPPASDAGPSDAAWLKDCDSVSLYYGLGVPADPVKARQCAFRELADSDRDGVYLGMQGAGLLTMIYANGKGVSRNLDYATYMACRTPSAVAESELRVEHLQKLKASGTREEFDYCTDITSGFAAGECSSVGARGADIERDARLSALTKNWNAPEKAALARLFRAQDAFIDARIESELDMGGTMRAVFANNAEAHVRDFTARLLEQLAAGQGPGGDANSAAKADAALNAMYKRARVPDPDMDPPRDIRPAQRAWLAYRDAWLALAKLKWPNVSSDGVLRTLTAERTRQMACDLGEGVKDGEADC